jgi:RNase P protein component
VPRVVIVSESEHKAPFGFDSAFAPAGEFAAVMEARRVVRGECFDLHFGPGFDGRSSGSAWIVSEAPGANAALRNAVKRQGREAFRLLAPIWIPVIWFFG